jgi:sugar lactone lactonase YvrE
VRSIRGDIYVGDLDTGELRKIARSGQVSVVADFFDESAVFAYLLGMDVDSNDNVYCAVYSDQESLNGVWQVSPYGNAARLAPMPLSSFPNDVALDRRGHLYVTDSYSASVWKFGLDGASGPWITDDLMVPGDFGPNGIALWHGSIYVAVTQREWIVRIPIRRDGSAGPPTIFVQDPSLVGQDGLEFDFAGNALVANNWSSQLLRIDAKDHKVSVVATEGLASPGGLTLGRPFGPEEDVYVANLDPGATHVVKIRICQSGQRR